MRMVSERTWRRAATLGAAFLTATGRTAPADDRVEPDGTEIVVTAPRGGADAAAKPATVFTAPGGVRSDARNTPEALRGLPSVMIQKTGNGQGSPYLRGFTGFRTLMLVDGVRLNNSVFRDGPNQYWCTVDPLAVGAYDVVLGPASVEWGSDAIGGAVNARPAELPPVGDDGWAPRLYARGGTADESLVLRAQSAGRSADGWGAAGGVSAKHFGDLRGGRSVGRQEKTGYDEQAADLLAEYRPAANARVTLGHQSVRQEDVWRTHRTIYGLDWKGLKHGDDWRLSYDQDRDLTWVRWRGDALAGGAADNAEVTVSRQSQREDQYRIRADGAPERQGFDVETWGLRLRAEAETVSGTWVYGADYYRDGVDSYARKYRADGALVRREIQGPVADEAAYDLAGVFAADTLRSADGAWEFTPGWRYQYARAEADRVRDPAAGRAISLRDDWSALVGSLRVGRQVAADGRLTVYGGVAQGFRAPNLSDLTRFDAARSDEIETPAPDLDPERFLTCDL